MKVQIRFQKLKLNIKKIKFIKKGSNEFPKNSIWTTEDQIEPKKSQLKKNTQIEPKKT